MTRLYPHFLTAVIVVGAMFAAPVFADQTVHECTCAVQVSGGQCNIQDSQVAPLDTSMSPLELLRRSTPAQSSGQSTCPIATAAAGQAALSQGISITEQTCASLTLAGSLSLNGTEYSYQIACEMKNRTEGTPGGVIQEIHLRNPLRVPGDTTDKGIVDFNVIIGKIILAATGILGSITLIVFAYGGFQWLLSRGNSEMITKGLNTMIYAAIGLCIIFGSYAILRTVFEGLSKAATG